MNISEILKRYFEYLYEAEKSPETVVKYVGNVRRFLEYLDDRPLDKSAVIGFKNSLVSGGEYSVGSINTVIAPVNSYLRYLNRRDCCVRSLRTHRKICYPEDKELTKHDYLRLLEAAGLKRQARPTPSPSPARTATATMLK